MTWKIPDWYALALLALAAYRLWRLLAEDTILDRPREWSIHRLGEVGGEKFSLFITCPWCAGFWVSVGWWLAWVAWPHWALVAATPFAISALVALIAVNLDPE